MSADVKSIPSGPASGPSGQVNRDHRQVSDLSDSDLTGCRRAKSCASTSSRRAVNHKARPDPIALTAGRGSHRGDHGDAIRGVGITRAQIALYGRRWDNPLIAATAKEREPRTAVPASESGSQPALSSSKPLVAYRCFTTSGLMTLIGVPFAYSTI